VVSSPACPKILVVDDYEDTFALVKMLAKKAGVVGDIDQCSSGVSALKQLKIWASSGSLPKLILLDIKMPVLNGFDVLRTLRRTEALRDILVVMLSSSAEPSDVALARETGADSYLVKYPSHKSFAAFLELSSSAGSRDQFAVDLKRAGFASALNGDWKF
jgi:two-component system, response regulator